MVTDPVAGAVLEGLNPGRAESLRGLYVDGMRRSEIYAAMAEKALCCVRQGHLTCFACYGHPGEFYANPIHHAIRRVRRRGLSSRTMLPGISTLDCLLADLEIDPAIDGLVSFDATDFLFNERDVQRIRRADPLASRGHRRSAFPRQWIRTGSGLQARGATRPVLSGRTPHLHLSGGLAPLGGADHRADDHRFPRNAAAEPARVGLSPSRRSQAHRRHGADADRSDALGSRSRSQRQHSLSRRSLEPEELPMSILSYPRIHFRGTITLNAATANDDDVVVAIDRERVKLLPVLANRTDADAWRG